MDNSEASGRNAQRLVEIPKPGWRDLLKRTFRGLSKDNASVIAAGVAFYAFLGIPAILTTLVSIYGLVANPAEVEQQVAALRGFIPAEGLAIVSDQLRRVSSQTGHSLTLALVGSTLFALWSGSNSMKALIMALNIANEEEEKRGVIKLNLIALGLTLGGLILVAVVIGLIVVVSAMADQLGLPGPLQVLIRVARWPVLAATALTALATAYRYCPSREEVKWRWVSWGAVLASGLWLVASALFSWYAGNFGHYNKTYGSLGAIVVLLMWFFYSAYVVLLGAKLNAEIEHQTAIDSTTGELEPMGKRGAA